MVIRGRLGNDPHAVRLEPGGVHRRREAQLEGGGGIPAEAFDRIRADQAAVLHNGHPVRDRWTSSSS